MNYIYNNDLVGKGKPWGERKLLLPWQLTIYARYGSMCGRCTNPNHPAYKTYGAIGIENHFTSLSHYYYSLKKQSNWLDFKKNPDKYEVDKDLKLGHGSHYSPDTILLVSKEDNRRERASRCNDINKAYEAHKRQVLLDGVVYDSLKSAAFGIMLSKSRMSAYANGYRIDNGVKKFIGHDFVDKLGIPHHIEYI